MKSAEASLSLSDKENKMNHPAQALRHTVAECQIKSFIGVYDVFSAALAAQQFEGLFLSGFGFAASHYGLPDVGFIAWPDMASLVQRIRAILPDHDLMVDIDDGYGDPVIAAHVAGVMEAAGASGVILEDQQRPRRCGHVDGKEILPLERFLDKLHAVLGARRNDLFVVARTDATDDAERRRRAHAFDRAGADAILVDGLENLDLLRQLSQEVSSPLMFNQMAGGKSPVCTLEQLREVGVSLVNYSTPCLFAAQEAIDGALLQLKQRGGALVAPEGGGVALAECAVVLQNNLARSS
jgi:2-methylisocitrate lyase-like PEP mutase family enzyme